MVFTVYLQRLAGMATIDCHVLQKCTGYRLLRLVVPRVIRLYK